MDLTEKEEEVFQFLKKKKKVHIDELIDRFTGENVNPKNARHAMNVRVKYLGAKISQHGWIIERVSGLGAGAKAIFSMEKKF